MIGDRTPLIFDENDQYYEEHGFDFPQLSHLDAIGLISFQAYSQYGRNNLPKTFLVAYFDDVICLQFPNETNVLATGKVVFTQIGEQLSSICVVEPIEGFIDYVLTKWTERGIKSSSQYPRVRVSQLATM